MDQLIQLFSGLSTRQRITIALAAILTGAGIYGFSHWKHESDFHPLYTSMAPEDAAGVVQKLRETGVEYRLSESGSAVMVPSSKLGESRLALAAAGLPKTGHIGFELFDKTTFGATDFVEHINYKRALEGELERSIMSLAEVEQSRVHLTLPKESVFIEKQQPAKASVIVKLRPSAQISQQNVQAITNLVASAVEGLGPESVSIVDFNGHLLNRPKRSSDADGGQTTAESLEFRQQIERDLIAKMHATLEPLVGPEKFRAGASVDCDLSSADQQEETFDPSRSVMASSQKTEDVTDRAAATLGVPGTASNLPGGAPSHPVGAPGLSRRTENVTFQSSRLVRHTRIPQGVIRRMSLSVLVDNAVRWEGEGKARHRVLEPPRAETIKTIKDLVGAATGFNAERGDQLIVESLPFESSLTSEPPPEGAPQSNRAPRSPATGWQKLLQNTTYVSVAIGVGILLVLLLVFAMVRRMSRRLPVRRPVEAPAALPSDSRPQTQSLPGDLVPRAGIEGVRGVIAQEESGELAARVRQSAQGDLNLTANVVRLWLQETESRTTV